MTVAVAFAPLAAVRGVHSGGLLVGLEIGLGLGDPSILDARRAALQYFFAFLFFFLRYFAEIIMRDPISGRCARVSASPRKCGMPDGTSRYLAPEKTGPRQQPR